MEIPVTDAFDETDTFESLNVQLHPDHIEWLQSRAEAYDLSIEHVLRSVINAQMRADDVAPSDASSNDESVVESLRTANERLQQLMERKGSQTDSDDAGSRSTLARLRARLDGDSENRSDGDRASNSSLHPPSMHARTQSDDADDTRSMFDMMGEE